MFAQITAVLTNKKLPEDKKKVLLAQETADGLANTFLYVCFTSILTKLISKKVMSGKILSSEISDNILRYSKQTKKSIPDVIKAMTQENPDKIYDSVTIKNFTSFHSGIKMLATIAGSVLAANIATPIVRNYTGNYYQKKVKQLEKVNPEKKTYTTFTTPAVFSSNPTFSNITKL